MHETTQPIVEFRPEAEDLQSLAELHEVLREHAGQQRPHEPFPAIQDRPEHQRRHEHPKGLKLVPPRPRVGAPQQPQAVPGRPHRQQPQEAVAREHRVAGPRVRQANQRPDQQHTRGHVLGRRGQGQQKEVRHGQRGVDVVPHGIAKPAVLNGGGDRISVGRRRPGHGPGDVGSSVGHRGLV
ncbi:MAG: hypothetical protein ACYSUF_05415 [Planctomycetota bacterium]